MMPSENSMNANKHFNKEASPQRNSSKIKKLKNKLTDKLGPQWTKDELERFYEAYQKQGRDWKKVAASVENNRSVDMVEALFRMNQYEYKNISLLASVDGLVAIMTDHYSLFEGKGTFDIKRSRAQLYDEVKEKYEATGRGLTDYSFLLDLPFSSCCRESLRDLQEASVGKGLSLAWEELKSPPFLVMIQMKERAEELEYWRMTGQKREDEKKARKET
ncbi:hypothetical protein Bca4012_082925 [Brassica carinata]